MKRSIFPLILGSALFATPVFADSSQVITAKADSKVATAEMSAVALQVSKAVKADPSKAGEIVKKAIRDSEANADQVAEIVVAAVTAAPEQIDAIAVASMAIAPDAFRTVAIALAKLDGYNFDEVAAKEGDPLGAPGNDDDALANFILGLLNGGQDNGDGTRQISVNASTVGAGGFMARFAAALTGSSKTGSITLPVVFQMPDSFIATPSAQGTTTIQITEDTIGNFVLVVPTTNTAVPEG